MLVVDGNSLGNTLQGIGACLGGAAALLGVILTIINKKQIGVAWSAALAQMMEPRLRDAERRVRASDMQRNEAEQRAQSAEGRAGAAEHSADSWESTATAIRAEITTMQKQHDTAMAEMRAQLDEVKVRNDALVDYSQKILEYSVSLEHRAIAAGVDLSGLTMPLIPAILADRLNIPETLR